MLEIFYRILFYMTNKDLENTMLFSLSRKIFKIIVNTLIPIYFKLFPKTLMGVERSSEHNIIVSLTSFPARIDDVWISIETLLRQTIKPNRIILWLAKDQFSGKSALPNNLLSLEKRGLEIKFCEDLRSHKKYYYTMLNYPDSNVIIVDDDMYYPKNLIQGLLNTAKTFPNTICCNRGHYIEFEDEKVLPYKKWSRKRYDNIPSFELCPTGSCGVFYPVNSLDAEVFNKKAIYDYCLNADDLWLKVMSVKKGIPAVKTHANSITFFDIMRTQSDKLTSKNVGKNMNDLQLNNIINGYKINLYKLIHQRFK